MYFDFVCLSVFDGLHVYHVSLVFPDALQDHRVSGIGLTDSCEHPEGAGDQPQVLC